MLTKPSEDLQPRLDGVCRRVFGRDYATDLRVAAVEEWDSLSHIRLVLELEREFALQIEPEAIPVLYSDGKTIMAYLRARRAVRA